MWRILDFLLYIDHFGLFTFLYCVYSTAAVPTCLCRMCLWTLTISDFLGWLSLLHSKCNLLFILNYYILIAEDLYELLRRIVKIKSNRILVEYWQICLNKTRLYNNAFSFSSEIGINLIKEC